MPLGQGDPVLRKRGLTLCLSPQEQECPGALEELEVLVCQVSGNPRTGWAGRETDPWRTAP